MLKTEYNSIKASEYGNNDFIAKIILGGRYYECYINFDPWTFSIIGVNILPSVTLSIAHEPFLKRVSKILFFKWLNKNENI